VTPIGQLLAKPADFQGGSADAEGQEAAREHAQHEGRPASRPDSTETAR
jgi:hypothetical protein